MCMRSRISISSATFVKAFHRQHGITEQDRYHYYSDEYLINQQQFSYLATQKDQHHAQHELKIPLITHRVWVTSPYNPREITDALSDSKLITRAIEMNQLLDRASQVLQCKDHTIDHMDGSDQKPQWHKKRYGYECHEDGSGRKWTHILWTNDKSLIPLSTKLFEENGIIIRELKELPSFQGVNLEAFNQFIRQEKVVAASDFARMMILYDHGGFYTDLDFFIDEFDIKTNQILDFVGFTLELCHYDTLFNFGIMARPNHPVIKAYLDQFIHNYLKKRNELAVNEAAGKVKRESHSKIWKDKPFNFYECYYDNFNSLFYETGPYLFDMVYLRLMKQKDQRLAEGDSTLANDIGQVMIIFEETDLLNGWERTIKVRDLISTQCDPNSQEDCTQDVKLTMKGEEIGQGSWANDFIDDLQFGWPDLNERIFEHE
eukprot:403356542